MVQILHICAVAVTPAEIRKLYSAREHSTQQHVKRHLRLPTLHTAEIRKGFFSSGAHSSTSDGNCVVPPCTLAALAAGADEIIPVIS